MSGPPRTATLVALVVLAAATGAGVPNASATGASSTADLAGATPTSAATPAAAASNESNASVDAWRVPASVDAANATASDLERHREPGDRTNLTRDDHLAVAVDAPGLDAAVANRSGNRTERALAALNDSHLLRVVQTERTTAVSLQQATLWLNASNTRVADAAADDRYVLVVDIDETIGVRDGDLFDAERSFAAAYEAHANSSNVVTFFEETWGWSRAVTVQYRGTPDTRVVAESRPVTLLRAAVDLHAYDFRAPTATANATVEMTASLRNGQELLATARVGGRVVDRDVVRYPTAGERFTATFDLSDVDAPATLNVSIERVGRPDAEQLTLGSDTVPVREPNASVSVWRIPRRVDAANASASELETHRHNATDWAYVTPGGRLAIGVHVPGLDAAAAKERGNRTERVLAALDESGYFGVRETAASTGTSGLSASLWLNASNVRAVRSGEDRYVLVVDHERVLAARFRNQPKANTFATAYAQESERFFAVAEQFGNDAYRARYYADADDFSPAATSRPVALVPSQASVDEGGPLESRAGQRVTGTTTLGAGTELVVTASADGEVVATDRVRVARNRTYAAALDLRDLGTLAVVNLTVAPARNRSRTLATTSVPVLEPDADLSFDDQTSTTRYVSVQAELTHGGVLVLRNDSGVVDVSERLARGVDRTVTFTLPANATNGTYGVVAYRGTPGDRGEQYPGGTANATLRFATEADGETTTTDSGTATTSTPTNATTPVAQPGFGAVGALAALAALVVAVAIGTRRRAD